MIVNLNHFKEQRPGITSFLTGITYFKTNNINANARKWFQLISFLTLINCYLLQWYSENIENLKNDVSRGHTWFYYKFLLVFQMCDVMISAYESYQLRKVKSYVYNNMEGVGLWIIYNDLYVLSSTVWCICYLRPNIEYHAIYWKLMLFFFTVYKAYIIYRMFKADKASHIVLEQISIPSEHDTPKSSVTKYRYVQLQESKFETTAEKLDNFVPLVHKSGLKSNAIIRQPTTVSMCN
ncbi:Hypothetical protein CINCED_3A019490 [Cinara cedri]|uniref:Uncharacterized protein n=1 Tax=Cinara cedri TaxID=506608 RepID=A0A5E4NB99_9HEMI|nr:Hypothetical protein CINCED_3A019490 [Cinara cedri]